MKTAIITTAVAVASLFTATFAFAQQPWQYAVRRDVRGPSAVYRHASTYEEGVQRGYADVVRARGDFNYNTSLANINNQIARDMAISNNLKATEAYFQQRQINREARAAERRPKPTQAQLQERASRRAPQRLTAADVDRETRRIYWPAVLLRDEYAAARTTIDRLYSTRNVHNSGLGSQNYQQTRQATTFLKAQLKSQIARMTGTEYMAAKKFITGIEQEAAYQSQHERVALNR